MYKISALLSLATAFSLGAMAQKVDFSVVAVPEESGLEMTRISKNSDAVAMPVVKRSGTKINWFSNRVLAPVPGGQNIAYLSTRNNLTNIFIKDASRQGASRQRTQRAGVMDFSFTPDGKYLFFSERRGNNTQIFRTDASSGFVCRQITEGANDYTPIVDSDGSQVFFSRNEKRGSSIWSYSLANNFLSSYTSGYNPAPLGKETIVVARDASTGNSEIWKINYATGEEECIIADTDRSFTSPILSPDGQWLLFVGSSRISTGKVNYLNTDLYVCRPDGTDLRQLTYHAADDLSPVWSEDGHYIYFVSQRGDPDGVANIWRLTFNIL
ncbi:MAG: hypothetical protein HDS49_01525 [Bacteroides sp.]|nr:hypothetical protein [Bacteroides sp.]